MLAMKCGFMRLAPLTSPVPSLLWLTSASTTCWTPTDQPDIASMGLCFGELRVKHVHLTSGKTARVSHLLWSIHRGTQNVSKTVQPFLHLLVLFLSHLRFLPVFPFSHPLHPSLPPPLFLLFLSPPFHPSLPPSLPGPSSPAPSSLPTSSSPSFRSFNPCA